MCGSVIVQRDRHQQRNWDVSITCDSLVYLLRAPWDRTAFLLVCSLWPLHPRLVLEKINFTSHNVVCVVTFNRSFYPTTSVHPVSVLIHPREIQTLWSPTVRQRKTKTTAINQGKASEILAYLVREHNKKTSQTRKKRKKRTTRKKTKKVPGRQEF